MSHLDWVVAAELAMPARAALSHVSRIQRAGLDIGPLKPIHFTIAGDHHLAVDGVFLHRTVTMPVRDASGVSPAAAFIQCCASMRLLDLIVIGDHLLARGLASVVEMVEASRSHPWRPGAAEARSVLPWLDARSRSPKESELRAYVVAAGLPRPEVNVEIHGFNGEFLGIVDLLFRRWRLALEYEGRQHAESMVQFQRDIRRYGGFRDNEVAYLQITAAMTPQPVAAVQRIHSALMRQGFDGPPPSFGPRWGALFGRVQARGSGLSSTESAIHSVEDEPPTRGFGR